MSRSLIARVIASVPLLFSSAWAEKPPLNVSVTNSPLPVSVSGTPAVTVGDSIVPVEVRNADRVPVSVASAPTPKSKLYVYCPDEGIHAQAGEVKLVTQTLTHPVVLKGISAFPQRGGCFAKFDVIPATGPYLRLFRLNSSSVQPESGDPPLPDLLLDAGDTIRVEVASSEGCGALISIVGVIP